MVIYGIGVFAAGFSSNISFMLFARAIQGIGLSMFPIAFSIIREQFPREKIAIGQGVISSMFATGSSIGFYVGGTIIQHFTWHATFFSIIPVMIVLLLTVWRFINLEKNNGRTNIMDPKQQLGSHSEMCECSHIVEDHAGVKKKFVSWLTMKTLS
jgi:MFS family permease